MSSYTDLKRSADIVAVIGRHVHLTKKSTEYRGHCPFHNDKKPSFMVNPHKRVWGCFVCGVGGDVIDFLKRRGMEHEQIIKELGGTTSAVGGGTQVAAAVASKPASTQVAGVRPARIKHPRMGEPVAVWEYHNAAGELWGLVCRFETAEGKQVLPYTCHNPRGWQWAGFDEPRPLYNLPELLARPKEPIIIVEGEKAAEAAKRLFKGAVASCWQGGTNAWRKADWGVVAGRKVILWPDNDEPGRRAMTEVAAHIAHACDVQCVQVPDVMPAKWDVADADWTASEAKEWLRGRLKPFGAVDATVTTQNDSSQAATQAATVTATQADEHFSVLGFVRDENTTRYVIYTYANKVTNVFAAKSLNVSTMISIAPLSWWQECFPAPKRASKFDADAALDWIIRLGDARGVFDLSRIRGRGAWMDSGRVVLHCGGYMIVDGKLTELGGIKSKFVYEQLAYLALDGHASEPMSDAEALQIFEFINSLNFARAIDGYLLAGWIYLAPVCGLLRWRPHIWMTGAAGSGKSWILTNLIRALIGEVSVNVQGETTEAGLRQQIGSDALPVTFDEAEGETLTSRQRLDGILGFARSSSSADGGMIAKGGQTGKALTFTAKSMLAMASIIPAISLKSDLGRFSVIEVIPDKSADAGLKWAAKQAEFRQVVTDASGDRFVARVVSTVPTLLANIEAASAAVAAVLGDQRLGDQIGALLAGSVMYYEPKVYTVEQFVQIVRKFDLANEQAINEQTDEVTLLNIILSAILKIDNGRTRTVHELYELATRKERDDYIEAPMAADVLLRHGFKAEGDYLIVSDSHEEIKNLLSKTQFARNHARTLVRLKGAEPVKAVRFKGATQRATKIYIHEDSNAGGDGSNAGGA